MIWIGPASSEQDFVVKTYRTTDLMLNDGDLYMVNPAGELLAYHHDRHGDFGDWKGKVIGSAWGDMTWIGAARGGSIYAVSRDGQLRYYHHNGGTFDDWNGRGDRRRMERRPAARGSGDSGSCTRSRPTAICSTITTTRVLISTSRAE
jgi:hypothetical protein